MSTDQDPQIPSEEQDGSLEEKTADKDTTGVEVGLTEGEGSTFEPEEDPEGHED